MTAEEFLKRQHSYTANKHIFPLGTGEIMQQNMIEFAKYHVRKALEYALEEVPYGGSDEIHYKDVEGILTCYPLENIK